MKTKILIIDDDPGVQEILLLIFRRAGYDVAVEANTELISKNQYELPDVFLLDRYLSGKDGLDICRHLKADAYSCHIPVIMVSASPDISTLALIAGADGFVEKPFSMPEMLKEIERNLKKPGTA